MTPEQLREIGEQLYGSWGWQTRMAEVLRVDSSTVRRWLAGKVAVPGPALVALELLLREHKKNTDN
jgi:DNA-binding transcriptional regulator YiaG